MPRTVQNQFNAGEITPKLYARADLEKYPNACKTLKNFIALAHGPVKHRPGSEFIAEIKSSSSRARLLPFQYSTEQAYVIEAGDQYMRFYMNGGQIQTVDSNTKLLIHANGTEPSFTFTDDGTTGHTITAVGNAQISNTIRKFGTGSLNLDGNGDYLTVADHADFAFGSSAVTIDTWVYFKQAAGMHCLYSQMDSTAGDYIMFLYDFETEKFYLAAMDAGSRVLMQTVSYSSFSAGQWYHVALVRGWGGNANDWAVVIGGTAAGTFTDASTLPDHDGTIRIGGGIADTLLIDFGNTGHVFTANGDATISHDQSYFGRGSMYFDGTGDYFSAPDHADWDISTNWTLDLFVKHTDHAGIEYYCGQWQSGYAWLFQHYHGYGLRFRIYTGSDIVGTPYGGEITDTDWHHIAVCKIGDEYGVYKDGVQVSYVSDSSMANLTGPLCIGAGNGGAYAFDGYIQNLRIYNGNPFSASPQSDNSDTITVPTAPHSSDANTKLLVYGEPKDSKAYLDEYRISTATRWASSFTPPTVEYPSGDDSGTVYELVTTYDEEDLDELAYTQSADTMYIAHAGYAPRKLTRTDHDNWSITDITFDWPPFLDVNDTTTTLTPSATSGSITLTASAAVFDALHVGAYFALNNGYVKITAVASSTSASADVVETLSGTGATSSWYEGAFSDYQGWPNVVTFYEDRLVFANTSKKPDTIWLSKTGDYENFYRGELDGSAAASDDSMTITLSSRQVNAIKWMSPTRKLLVGTSGGEWWIDGSSSSEPLDATQTPRVHMDSEKGSDAVSPLILGNSTIFVQKLGKTVLDIFYSWQDDQYVVKDIGILAEHLLSNYTIKQFAWQQTPAKIVWALKSDGELLGLTYMKEHKVVAWHQHVFGGSFVDGATTYSPVVESIASINGTDEDELWLIIKRTINSSTKRYIERLRAIEAVAEEAGKTSYELADMCFLDSSLTYRGTAATTISGLDHLAGETVYALADGTVISGLTVSDSGTITLSQAASVVHVGLYANADLQTVEPIVVDEKVSISGTKKRLTNVILRLYESQGGTIGPDSDNLISIPYDSTTTLYSGFTRDIAIYGGTQRDATLFLRCNEPLPMTVVSLTMDVEI